MVVEAPPPSAFGVAQSQFLLEFLIVSLDPPTQLGGADQLGDRSVGRQGGEPILLGSTSPSGHSIRSHSWA